jgi:hypothetical protein
MNLIRQAFDAGKFNNWNVFGIEFLNFESRFNRLP